MQRSLPAYFRELLSRATLSRATLFSPTFSNATLSCLKFGTLLPALLIGGVFTVDAQTLYKTVDAQGRVSYSDKPVNRSSQAVEVKLRPANSEDASRLQREQAEAETYAERVRREQTIEAQKNAEQQQKRREYERRCQQVREDYRLLSEGGRLYQRNENGERQYLSNEEILSQREDAKAIVDQYCSE